MSHSDRDTTSRPRVRAPRQGTAALLSGAVLGAVLACVLTLPASAQWRSTGVPLCTALQEQSGAVSAPDGAGGAFVAWQDYRNGSVSNGLFDIYAQHVLATGLADPAWPADGAPVCALADFQITPTLLADGAGGAFIAWLDRRSGTAYAPYLQHLLATGVDAAWPANGRLLSTAAGSISVDVQMVRDASTGVLTLCNMPSGGSQEYVQHVLGTGALDPNFTATGVLAGSGTSGTIRGSLVTDNAGGAIVAWAGSGGVFAMHVQSSGAKDAAWPAAGRNLLGSGSGPQSPVALADGAGGAIVAWGQIGVTDFDIYAQHVLSTGAIDTNWPAAGLVVCSATGTQQTPRIASDGNSPEHGAIVAWMDVRNGADFDVYAQHVRGRGDVDPTWIANGRAISTAVGNQLTVGVAPDGFNGALVLWEETSGSLRGLYAQRVLGNGFVDTAWPAGGAVLTPFDYGYTFLGLTPDGAGGVLVPWHEYRIGRSALRDRDVYLRDIPYTGTHRITPTPGSGGVTFVATPDSLNLVAVNVPFIDVTAAEATPFRFAPNPGFSIADVSVNGVSQGVPPNYTFTNVTLDRTLAPTFSNAPWAVDAATPGVSYVPVAWPLTYADSSVSVLLPNLWPVDDGRWRLAHWDPVLGRYAFASDSLHKLQAGAGYWLATMTSRVVSVQGSPLATPSASVPLLGDLASGWNQIGNPYRFPIADSALTISTGGPAVAFTDVANTSTDHSISDWTGGSSYTTVHTLQPNRSYWVHKLVSGAVTLKFPNRASVGPPGPVPALPAGAEWAVGVVARQGSDRTSQVLAGAWPPAHEAISLRREAPPQGPQGGVALHIGQPGDAGIRQIADIVPAGAAWTWTVEISGAQVPGEVQLDIAGYDLPAGLHLWLADPASGWKREVQPGGTVTIAAYAPGRRLTLEANHESSGAAIASAGGMLAAYPNPFQRQVGLMCALSAGGTVRVQILDLQGRLVRSLERRGAPAGENVIVWDGNGANGAAVRPGVYLARFQDAGAARTVRLVRLD